MFSFPRNALRNTLDTPKAFNALNGFHAQVWIDRACHRRKRGFMPCVGHLLLSGSLDGKCKIWGVYNEDRNVKRTYTGHSEGIRCDMLLRRLTSRA